MKIACVSDLHGNLIDVGSGDLLLLGGDITPTFPFAKEDLVPYQLQWMDKILRPWLENLDFKWVVHCFGNHDLCMESKLKQVLDMNLRWNILMDQEITVEGFKIYGSPWNLRFFDWAFNLDENELAEKWKLIPKDADILLLHQPPKGYGDIANSVVGGKMLKGVFEHAGSESLTSRIRDIRPKLVVYGHLHMGYGSYVLDNTILINAAIVDEHYNPTNKPIEIDSDQFLKG